MRYLLIVSFLMVSLFAKNQETCYSVQITSFYKKEAGFFDISRYPESCELMSISNMRALRCGCYDNAKDAFNALEDLKPTYRKAILAETYKYRFKNLNKEIIPVEIEPQISQESNFEFQGNVNLEAQTYLTKPDGKHKSNLTASTKLEVQYEKDDFKAIGTLYAQQDSHDFKSSDEQNNRSFIRLDELYGTYDFEDDQVMFGKNIRFWGSLELRNITDGFNPQDMRSDPFKNDKLGVWNAAYTHYTDSGEFSAIVKLDEQDRDISAFPYVYYYFPEHINYDSSLKTQESKNRPTVYLKYSGSTDSELPLDYAIIYQNGYDSQRYMTTNMLNGSFEENAYIVNKLMTYNTLVVDSTLFKVEALYTDVKNDNVISDYYQLGLGVEHTLSQVYNQADLGLIAEYYKYGTFEKDKRNDLQLFEVFQNDLFLGLRYSFNEGNDASIISGVILDLDYNEQAYYIEYESRIANSFKLKFDYRYIEPSHDHPTVYNLLKRHQRFSLNLGYHF